MIRAGAAIVALPLNVWADVVFDPPLGGAEAPGRDQRHPGGSRRCSRSCRRARQLSRRGMGHADQRGVHHEAAGDNRLFMGFSVQDRVDLSDQRPSRPR